MTKQAFLFSGLQGKFLSYLPWDVTDILEARGYECHVFSDSKWRLFLDGGDRFGTAEEMRDFMSEKSDNAEHSLTLAVSGGSPGGMINSIRVGIDCIIGLSPFTTCTVASRQIDRRGARIFKTVDELIPEDEQRSLDFHIDENNYTGEIHLFYSQLSTSERYQAEHIRDYECVYLHPRPTRRTAFSPMIRHGRDVLGSAGQRGIHRLLSDAAGREIKRPMVPIGRFAFAVCRSCARATCLPGPIAVICAGRRTCACRPRRERRMTPA